MLECLTLLATLNCAFVSGIKILKITSKLFLKWEDESGPKCKAAALWHSLFLHIFISCWFKNDLNRVSLPFVRMHLAKTFKIDASEKTSSSSRKSAGKCLKALGNCTPASWMFSVGGFWLHWRLKRKQCQHLLNCKFLTSSSSKWSLEESHHSAQGCESLFSGNHYHHNFVLSDFSTEVVYVLHRPKFGEKKLLLHYWDVRQAPLSRWPSI